MLYVTEHNPAEPSDNRPPSIQSARNPEHLARNNPDLLSRNPELLPRNPELLSRNPAELDVAAAQAQMMARAYGASPFGLFYQTIPIAAVNPALYAVHSAELLKPGMALGVPSPVPSRNNSPFGNTSKQSMEEATRRNSPTKFHPPGGKHSNLTGAQLLGEDYERHSSYQRELSNKIASEHNRGNTKLMDRSDINKPRYEPESFVEERNSHVEKFPSHQHPASTKSYLDTQGDSMLKCYYCSQEFTTRDWGMFRRHMRSHETMSCSDCHVQFRDRNELQLHMSLFHKSHTCVCKVCKVGFENIDTLYKHVYSVHHNSSNVQLDFCCLHCNTSFSNERDLSEHRQLHNYQDRGGSPGANVSISLRARVKDQEVSMSPPPNVVHRVTPDTTCKEETRLPSSEPETVISRSDSKPDDTVTSYCVSPLSKPVVSSNSRLSPESAVVKTNAYKMPPVSVFEMLEKKVEYEHHRQAGSDDHSRPNVGHHDNGKVEYNDSKLLNSFLKRKLEDEVGHSAVNKVPRLDTYQDGVSGDRLEKSSTNETYTTNSTSGHPRGNMNALVSSLLSLPQQPDIKQLVEAMANKNNPVKMSPDSNNVMSNGNRRSQFMTSNKFTDSDLIAATVLAEISGSVVSGVPEVVNNAAVKRFDEETCERKPQVERSVSNPPCKSPVITSGESPAVDGSTEHHDGEQARISQRQCSSESNEKTSIGSVKDESIDPSDSSPSSSAISNDRSSEIATGNEGTDKLSCTSTEKNSMDSTVETSSPSTDISQQQRLDSSQSYSPKLRILDRNESFDDSPLVIAWDEESEKNNEKSDTD